MTSLVQFPGLGFEFEVSRVAFTLFGMPIYWYGVLIGLGVMLAIAFALWQGPKFGLDPDRMIDVIVVGLISGVIGARLYYVVFVSTIEYHTFYDLINLRDGGLAIYGGIIFGFLGALAACKWRKVPVLPMFDLVAMGFLIGQALGRWGNFTNQEAFGGNTTLPWGMLSNETTAYLMSQQTALAQAGMAVNPMLPVHPTFLYESLWCVLGFVLLFLYRKRRHFNGEIALFYVMWYGLGRFFIEGLRTDSLMFMGLRVSQVLAAASVLAAFCVWLAARMRTAGKPLKIPVPPPRTARVKLDTKDGPATVIISWPSGEKAPTKAERETMALELWEKEQAGETAEKAAEAPGEEEPDAGFTEEALKEEPTEEENTAAKQEPAPQKGQKSDGENDG